MQELADSLVASSTSLPCSAGSAVSAVEAPPAAGAPPLPTPPTPLIEMPRLRGGGSTAYRVARRGSATRRPATAMRVLRSCQCPLLAAGLYCRGGWGGAGGCRGVVLQRQAGREIAAARASLHAARYLIPPPTMLRTLQGPALVSSGEPL